MKSHKDETGNSTKPLYRLYKTKVRTRAPVVDLLEQHRYRKRICRSKGTVQDKSRIQEQGLADTRQAMDKAKTSQRYW